MITREDEPLLFAVKMQEFLENIQHTVLLQNALPQIRGGIAVGIGRIARAAVTSRAVGALVEGKKICTRAVELGCHIHIGVINAEIRQHTAVEAETHLTRVTVVHPLAFRVLHVLSGVLVFEFQRDHRNAVEHQRHIHGVFVVGGIIPLPDAVADIFTVECGCHLIESRFGSEITDAEGNAPVLEAVAEDIHQSVHFTGIVEGGDELLDRLAGADFFKAFPLSRLCPLHEGNEGIDIQAGLRIIAVGCLGISSLSGYEEGFYIRFKAFFGGVYINRSPLFLSFFHSLSGQDSILSIDKFPSTNYLLRFFVCFHSSYSILHLQYLHI